MVDRCPQTALGTYVLNPLQEEIQTQRSGTIWIVGRWLMKDL